MSRYQTFPRGGVHPPEGKSATSVRPIVNAPLPSTAVIPFSQHIGAPALPLVEQGQKVEEGQRIGEPAGFVSCPIHAPIPGTVTELKNIFLPNGISSMAAVIELDGEFSRLGKDIPTREWENLDRKELLEIVADRGLVGQGGATFPTHVKFTVPRGKSCEIFVVNAAECEPYLSADHRLLLERTDEVIEGIKIARKILEPSRVIVGIEANKLDAAALLEEKLAGDDVEVIALKPRYPQGAEKTLIQALLGVEVPSGKLPIEVEVINANTGTLFSLYEAVVLDKPVTERVVTVAGGAVTEPKNIRARLGTPVRDLIEECGGFRSEPAKLVSGGPMMGFAFDDLDTPVTKGTSGILALTEREVRTAESTACLSCGRCIDACPMGLVPTRLFKLVDHERMDDAMSEGLADCVECGACAYACPARIPLVSVIRTGKRRLRRMAAGKGA